MKEVLDVRGLPCPKPVLEVKKAIESSGKNEFEVITNSMESKENILRFLTSQNINVLVTNQAGDYVLSFRVEGPANLKEVDEASYVCNVSERKGMIISKIKLGDGDDTLGKILIRSFIQTLMDVEPLPSKIFFVNSGIFLTLEDSPVLEELKKITEKGVKIYSCGTCLDFYKVKDKLAVGEVGNMFLLLEILSKGGIIL